MADAYAMKSERTLNAPLRLLVPGECEPRPVPRLSVAHEASVHRSQGEGVAADDDAAPVVLDRVDDGVLSRAEVEHAHGHAWRRQHARGHVATLEVARLLDRWRPQRAQEGPDGRGHRAD